MIRNIIWDVDGTLFDTYPAISRAFRAALNELGRGRAARIESPIWPGCRWASAPTTLAAEHGLDGGPARELPSPATTRRPARGAAAIPGAREICELVIPAWRPERHRHPSRVDRYRRAAGRERPGRAVRSAASPATTGTRRKPDPAAFIAIMARHDLVAGRDHGGRRSRHRCRGRQGRRRLHLPGRTRERRGRGGPCG